MTRVGTDVVDLQDPRCRDKASDQRFVARIFTADEARAIREAPSSEMALWLRWAAKEAAFKVVTGLRGSPPPFEHSAFQVRSEAPADPSAPVRGEVRYGGARISFSADRSPDRLHVLAWHHPGSEPGGTIHSEARLSPEIEHHSRREWRRDLRRRFTDQEWSAVHSPASALVRLRARSHLARVLEVEDSELEIVCEDGPSGRMPPRVLLHGEEYPGDLSLSHHGRFLAWAFTAPR